MVTRSLPFDCDWLAKVERRCTSGRTGDYSDPVLISLVRREIISHAPRGGQSADGESKSIENNIRDDESLSRLL